jgi:hypothetical protein
MTSSEPEPNIALQPRAKLPGAGVSLPKLLVVAAVLLPFSAILITLMLVVITNNLDVAYALGVSDTFLTGFVIAATGLVTGLITALVAGLRRWELVGPPVAGMIVGVGVHLGFAAFEPGEVLELGSLGLMTIGIGQMIAIVASTRIAGRPLAGVVLAVMVLGIAAAGLIQAIPPAPAEVLLVLDEYTVEDATGLCSGAGALAGVVEGSELLLLELPEGSGRPAEMGSVVLPKGFEGGGRCMFELGSPLGLPVAGYERIDFLPESDPGVPYTVSLEGNRVIVNLHRAEA